MRNKKNWSGSPSHERSTKSEFEKTGHNLFLSVKVCWHVLHEWCDSFRRQFYLSSCSVLICEYRLIQCTSSRKNHCFNRNRYVTTRMGNKAAYWQAYTPYIVNGKKINRSENTLHLKPSLDTWSSISLGTWTVVNERHLLTDAELQWEQARP